MAEIDSSYQDNVGREQGANTFFMKAAGVFKFFDKDLTGTQLKARLGQTDQGTVEGSAGVISVVTVPDDIKYYFISLADAQSNASIRLPLCNVDQELHLVVRGQTSAGSVLVTGSGVTINDYSSVSIRQSNDNGSVFFKATASNVWSVVSVSGATTRTLS